MGRGMTSLVLVCFVVSFHQRRTYFVGKNIELFRGALHRATEVYPGNAKWIGLEANVHLLFWGACGLLLNQIRWKLVGGMCVVFPWSSLGGSAKTPALYIL